PLLRVSDSRNFGRTLAALGLVAGPALYLLATLVDPAWSDDPVTYMQEVADAKGRYVLAGVLWTLGSFLFVAGALGVVRLLRGRAVTLGQVGGCLLTIGAIGTTGVLAFYGFDVALADFADRPAAVAFSEELEASALLNAYYLVVFLGGIALGSVLLAIALIRRRLVPIWSPILLMVSPVLAFIGQTRALGVLSLLLFVVALFPLAMRIWALSDDDWERWEPLPSAPGSPEPPPTI
ncbi:MAG: hypothetical protein M3198_17265, partial [Actinomycetota bacterium]|nr:hypothetical protein [Actinomycetota bacterium]